MAQYYYKKYWKSNAERGIIVNAEAEVIGFDMQKSHQISNCIYKKNLKEKISTKKKIGNSKILNHIQ